MHEAFCADRESLHLTISIEPLTFADLIRKALACVSESDVAFRRRVPWSVASEGNDLEDLAQQAREHILELSQRLDVGALMESERRSFDTAAPQTASGQLESVIASLMQIGPRPD
jgi:hypothetical protein